MPEPAIGARVRGRARGARTTCGSSSAGMPGPVSATLERPRCRPSAWTSRRDLVARAAVAGGVGEQVGHGLVQPVGVAAHRGRCVELGGDASARRRPAAGAGRPGRRGRCRPGRCRPGAATGRRTRRRTARRGPARPGRAAVPGRAGRPSRAGSARRRPSRSSSRPACRPASGVRSSWATSAASRRRTVSARTTSSAMVSNAWASSPSSPGAFRRVRAVVVAGGEPAGRAGQDDQGSGEPARRRTPLTASAATQRDQRGAEPPSTRPRCGRRWRRSGRPAGPRRPGARRP